MAKLPVLLQKRLILREVTEADAPAYEKRFVDYEVKVSWLPWFRGLIQRAAFSILFDTKLFRARATIGGYGEFYWKSSQEKLLAL